MQDPTPLKEAGSKEADLRELSYKIATAEATFRAQAFSLEHYPEPTQEDIEMTLMLAGHVTDLLTQLLEAHDLPTYIED